jgi:hypothetical protein
VNEQARDYEPFAGAIYGALGIVLTIIGALVLAKANEVALAIIIGAALAAGGAFAIIAGAVARGIQLARRWHYRLRPSMPLTGLRPTMPRIARFCGTSGAARHSLRAVGAIVYFAVPALVTVWAAFWVIRLAVRHGMNDALRMNREWLSQRTGGDGDDGPTR